MEIGPSTEQINTNSFESTFDRIYSKLQEIKDFCYKQSQENLSLHEIDDYIIIISAISRIQCRKHQEQIKKRLNETVDKMKTFIDDNGEQAPKKKWYHRFFTRD